MRVLMLSWEYPPKSVGGLAQHVYDLTRALVESGEEIHLITLSAPGAPAEENVNGVYVYRVQPYDVSSADFSTWVAQINVALLERAINVVQEAGQFNLVHAHDWLVAYAARAIKHAYRIPLVATIHATEYGRNYGLHNNLQRHISNVEWWLSYEAWRVICCSEYMKGEVKFVFQTPDDKISVIPNGVNIENFKMRGQQVTRDMYAAPDERIVFYVGRLVREKGVQVLLDAVPDVLYRCPGTKFVIAGRGPYEEPLRRQASYMGIENRVYFTGYIDDQVRNLLYSWASAAVFPSLYEPFGIVALEAMAAGTPVVVADTGGLGEIIRHGIDGLKAVSGNSRSLADMLIWALNDRELAERLKVNAFKSARENFSWREIARQTREVYQQVLEDSRSKSWYMGAERNGHLLGRVSRIFASRN